MKSSTPRPDENRALRAVVETAAMDWEASPASGVWRKKLERAGEESGQVTSVVRYAPGSRFAAHEHPLGEEIFVLSGVFADDEPRTIADCADEASLADVRAWKAAQKAAGKDKQGRRTN